MDLSQAEVDAFMEAEKVVPDRPMIWAQATPREATWNGPLEVGGVGVGNLFLRANLAVDRHWTFKVLYHGTDVYRLDVRPPPVRHSNPRFRPV